MSVAFYFKKRALDTDGLLRSARNDARNLAENPSPAGRRIARALKASGQ
jgi:hypothetical protein